MIILEQSGTIVHQRGFDCVRDGLSEEWSVKTGFDVTHLMLFSPSLSQGYIQKGLFSFTYGGRDSRVEFLHVDNLVQAHVRAGEALSAERDHVAVSILSRDHRLPDFRIFWEDFKKN